MDIPILVGGREFGLKKVFSCTTDIVLDHVHLELDSIVWITCQFAPYIAQISLKSVKLQHNCDLRNETMD